MRHQRRSELMPSLDEAIPEMVSVIERRRHVAGAPHVHDVEGHVAAAPGRELKGTVTVLLWQEEDGSETVEVVGKPETGVLALKGLLHDGLYALIHEPA